MTYRTPLLFALCASLAACTPKAAPETDPTEVAPAAETAAAEIESAERAASDGASAEVESAPANPADMLGDTSEEAFKALHVLKEE